MGTAKRERQKANKLHRESELARQEAKSRSTKIGVLVVGAIIAVFAIVVIAGQFITDDEDDTVVTEEGAAQQPVEAEPAEEIAEEVAEVAEDVEEPATTDAPAADPNAPECPPVEGTDEVIQSFDAAPPMCLDPAVSYSALVETTAGDLTIDLDQESAPTTVNSFVFLARNNYFDGVLCHRVVQDFVAQCGDPTETGTGGPGYRFDDELPEAGAYEIGSIAMANSGPNTNGSQFFIISGPNGAALPPQYSLFGDATDADDLVTIGEMDARSSEFDGGEARGEVRILDVTIIES